MFLLFVINEARKKMKLTRNNVVLPSDMEKECIGICELLNSLPTVKTFESCCGHLKNRFSVWFFCDSIDVLTRLGRATERNYSDNIWEVVVDSADSHPYGVFWLRSKNPFETNEEMKNSLDWLMDGIRHWCKDEFDSYFETNKPKNQETK